MPLYAIHFRRNYNTPKDFVAIGAGHWDGWRKRVWTDTRADVLGLDTLEKARNARKVTGDLVVDWQTHQIITNPAWLFDFEEADPNCYAQKAIRFGK